MSLLSGIVSAAGLIAGASAAWQQLNKPETQPANTLFLDVLQQTMKADKTKSAEENALLLSKRFIQFRDTTGDKRLSRPESGFAPELFNKFDKNGDGYLCEQELMPLFMAHEK